MKRKMIGAAAAYMSGLFFASFFTEGSDLLLLAGLLPVLFMIGRMMKLPSKDSLLITLFFAFSSCSGMLYTHLEYDKITAYSETAGSFSGEITDVKFYDAEKALYTLDGRINGTQKARIVFFENAYDVQKGDIITLESCEFRIPESTYLFDSERYYKSKNIFLMAENTVISEIRHTDSHKLERMISEYRERIVSEFSRKMGTNHGSFLSSIVFGETSGLDENEETLMYRCGIGHIMAVSGLHVSIVAALLMFLLNRLRIGKYVSFLLLNVFLMLMIIMVESPVSAIRAAIMLDFMYSARLFRRQNDTLNSLSAAVLLICLSNPYVIYDSGFLLSISGTFGIGVFAPYMTQNMSTDNLWRKFFKNVTAMFCTSLVVMPFSIYFFEETSLISPVMNVLIIPLTVIAMVLGMIYVLTGGLISLLTPAGLLIEIVLLVTDKLGRLSFTHFACGNTALFRISVLCAVSVIFIAFLFKSRKYTAIMIAGVLAIFVICSSVSNDTARDQFKIAVLGSGTNATAVISYKGRTDVIDLSGHYKSPRYVRRYLALNGISEIQTLSLTADIYSQYSSYRSALALVDIENKFSSKTLCLPDGFENDTVSFENSTLKMVNNKYSISLGGGVLRVDYGNQCVSILHTNSEVPEDTDFAVRYGNITKETVLHPDGRTIYLDEVDEIFYPYSDMNNFELILSPSSGEIRIRRL
ncbi:MAG: ComEC/Rec2 family competence protein [Ruminococcus sp.]|nr:ComEC/Rec2 family competence protein [Ruminococcus sp.]